MKRHEIIVPRHVKFLSDWKEFKLFNFPYILDKKIPGCGFTKYCLVNSQNIILCSPRRILLENKEEQHNKDNPGSVLYVRNKFSKTVSYDKDIQKDPKITEAELTENINIPSDLEISESIQEMYKTVLLYIEDRDMVGEPYKLMVTYDSFRILKDILIKMGIFHKFYTVIDEAQAIFTDSRFKSDTEMDFMNALKDVNDLCYVSATPMIDKYLEMLDEFKDLPYYELDWISDNPFRVQKPDLKVRALQSITSIACDIIQTYKDGKFEEAVDYSGNLVQSKEAVFYINSVSNLLSIIKKARLKPEEVNILCADTEVNVKKIHRTLGKNFFIGKVPKRNDPHKMFTFCTRTVYVGADFYSLCARTFIISDANIKTLAVDITLDLSQILGRQRLEENPWMNRAEIFIKTLNPDKLKSSIMFKKELDAKIKETKNLLSAWETSEGYEVKHDLAKNYKRIAKSFNYKDNYIAVNEHNGSDLKPVFNNLVLISEMRAYEIQQIDYADRFTVINRMSEVTGGNINSKVLDFMDKFNKFKEFYDRIKLLCEYDLSEDERNYVMSQMNVAYKKYYVILGPEKLKSLGYHITKIQKAFHDKTSVDVSGVEFDILNTFVIGERYTKSDIKDMLSNIYNTYGYSKTPIASDLENYFELKKVQITNKKTGKRDNGYRIIKKLV